jgi:hypothetical protein
LAGQITAADEKAAMPLAVSADTHAGAALHREKNPHGFSGILISVLEYCVEKPAA